MLGSKKRDYKTEHTRTVARLKRHKARMEELMEQGFSKEEASKKAYKEIVNSE